MLHLQANISLTAGIDASTLEPASQKNSEYGSTYRSAWRIKGKLVS